MGPSWALASAVAMLIVLVSTPVLRRWALAMDLVDQPAAHKVHATPVPYLGGVALIVSVLVGLLLTPRLAPGVGVIALGAALLGTVGLLDDDRTVAPRYRFLAELVAAAAAAAVGLRVHATGVAVLDVAVTLLWIVGITNAFNLLDNMDGLAAGVAATAALAVFALAVPEGQQVAANLAAVVAGASLAFLAYNRRPASIFMGDAGSLFLGFVLAVLTVDVNPALDPPGSFAVPVLLLALPVLDTTAVTLGRLRRARPVSIGGKDHLSHRLVARGLSPGRAVMALVAVEAVLATLAVLAGRGALPLGWAVLAAVGVLGLLTAAAAAAPVYAEPVVGVPRRLVLAVLAVALGTVMMAAPALVALVRAGTPARAGAEAAQQGLRAAGEGDSARAEAELERARGLFALAQRRLHGPLTSLGSAVPGLSSNLNGARTLVSVGRELAGTGTRLARTAQSGQLRVQGGSLPVEELRRVAPELGEAARVLRLSRARLAGLDQPYVLPSLRHAVDDLDARLARQTRMLDAAAESARLLPGVLGADGTRRYFLAVQNNAELRATGGFIGNWGELVAEGGRLRLERFGRIDDLRAEAEQRRAAPRLSEEYLRRYRGFFPEDWRQLNISPDFPTAARVISDLYPQSGGHRVDGVVAVDPLGLASLLELTGPVQVEGWPEPITAANVVEVSLRDHYERFADRDERAAFLGLLAQRVFQAFTAADLGNPARLTTTLGPAAGKGHLLAYLQRPEEQRLMGLLGADGAIPPVRGDSLLLVNQNVSGNKVDLYLRRRLRYDVQLDPGRTPAAFTGLVEARLENNAPPSGLALGVLGPFDDRFAPGENRTYVSVYSPFELRGADLDGRPLGVESQTELGRSVHSAVLSIPALESRTLRLEMAGRIQLAPGGWYRLDLLHQPSLVPDDADISLTVPRGWRIAEARGLRRTAARRAGGHLRLESPATIMVRVERTSSLGLG